MLAEGLAERQRTLAVGDAMVWEVGEVGAEVARPAGGARDVCEWRLERLVAAKSERDLYLRDLLSHGF